MGHFLCMVFHWDFVIKKGVDINIIKQKILFILEGMNAKYPAEHNVGHIYKAEQSLEKYRFEGPPQGVRSPPESE